MSDILDSLLRVDGLIPTGASGPPQWGIFKDGEPVVVAESVNSFGYRQDWPISTYQVEQGAFESYDKVQLPYEARVRFITGGTEEEREELLASIEAIAGDLELYDIVTPEKTYIGANVTRCAYERPEGHGAGIIKIDVYLMEVRIAASPQYNTATPLSNTKSPTAADPINNGTVQPQAPTATEQSLIESGALG